MKFAKHNGIGIIAYKLRQNIKAWLARKRISENKNR